MLFFYTPYKMIIETVRKNWKAFFNIKKEFMMKKFLVFAMLVVLAISCVAVEAKDLTIAFSQIGQESDWRTANTDSVNKTIEAHEGWTLVYDDAQQKQENQIKALRNFITQIGRAHV